MLKPLMLVSGVIEVLFGLSALVAPVTVVESVGGSTSAEIPTLALIRLLGAATLGLGVAALVGRSYLDTMGEWRPPTASASTTLSAPACSSSVL